MERTSQTIPSTNLGSGVHTVYSTTRPLLSLVGGRDCQASEITIKGIKILDLKIVKWCGRVYSIESSQGGTVRWSEITTKDIKIPDLKIVKVWRIKSQETYISLEAWRIKRSGVANSISKLWQHSQLGQC